MPEGLAGLAFALVIGPVTIGGIVLAALIVQQARGRL